MTTSPGSRCRECAGRQTHYLEWSAVDADVVIAWHRLARTGRDVNDLAAHLSMRGWP